MNSSSTKIAPSLKKIFIGVTAANLIAAVFSFLSMVMPARMLEISLFGRLSFIFALIAILSCVADFGFSQTVVIYHNRHQKQNDTVTLGKINRLFFRYLLLILVVLIPLAILLGKIYQFVILEIIVVLSSTLLYTITRYCSSIHQATGDWSRYNGLTITTSALRLLIMAACMIAAYKLTGDAGYNLFLAGFLTQAIINCIGTLAFSWPIPYSTTALMPEERLDITQILLPLGLSAIVIVVCMRFDSVIIEKVLGAHELGIYSAANTLAFAFPVLTGSLMNVLLRESAQMKDIFLSRLFASQKRYLLPLLVAFVLVQTCSGPLITLIFGDKYNEAIPIFRMLLIPYMGGIFFTPLESYFYAREPNTILWLKISQMLLIVVGSIILIGSFGLIGVALSIILSRVLGWLFIYTKSSLAIASSMAK